MLINGKPSDKLPADDRGLLYGDGLFETLAVRQGRCCLWQRHLARLHRGAEYLGIPLPDTEELLQEIGQEIGSRTEGVIKIILTRGSAGRGYRPPKHPLATRIVSMHKWPDYPPDINSRGARVRCCQTRLGHNTRLAGLKTLNRLEQVLARSEWTDPEIDEGLMLDNDGYVIEGTMSNLFVVRQDRLITPDLSQCGIAGVMRGLVLEIAPRVGLSPSIEKITLQSLAAADALFVTNSLIGLWPLQRLDAQEFDPTAVPATLVEAVLDEGFGV